EPALAGVVESRLDSALEVEPARAGCDPAEVDESAAGVLLEIVLDRELEAARELLLPLGALVEELDRPHVVQRMQDDLGVAHALTESERLCAPGEGARLVLDVHADRRGRAISQREVAARRQLLEHLDRLPHRVVRLLDAVATPQTGRERAQREALVAAIADRTMDLERLLERGDRLVGLVREVALVRAPFEQLRLCFQA